MAEKYWIVLLPFQDDDHCSFSSLSSLIKIGLGIFLLGLVSHLLVVPSGNSCLRATGWEDTQLIPAVEGLLGPSHQAVLFDTRRPCVIKVGESENAHISAGSSILWTAGHFSAKKTAVAESPGSFVWYSQTLCYQGRRVRKCPDIGRIKLPVAGRAVSRQINCCGRATRQFCLILADLVLSRSANQKMPWYRPDQASCGRQGTFPPKRLLWPS